MTKVYLTLLCAFFICTISFAQTPGNKNLPADFFPIAVWAQNPTNAEAYKNIGVDMYVSVRLNQENLDLLKKAGMKVIAHQNEFGMANLQDKTIYAWMHGDEPDNAQAKKNGGQGYDPCIDPALIIADYEKIKQSDPSRPVYLNLGRAVAYTKWGGRGACTGNVDSYKMSKNGYLKGCDLASFDIYPVNANEPEVKDRLEWVATGIKNLIEWSDYSKPMWCWIETCKIGEKTERVPSPAEIKSEVWMALIHGAKGFGYFCHSFLKPMDTAAPLHNPETSAGLKAINAEVTSLAKVLNSENTKDYATVQSSNNEVPVDLMTKKQGKENYLFAIAMTNGSTKANFKVKSGKKVEVIGENRTINIEKGSFSDDFGGYGVHLYKIN
jgi:hypothetical protein